MIRPGTLYGFNLINASYYEGFLRADLLPPISDDIASGYSLRAAKR
jgi:hypothetical protein